MIKIRKAKKTEWHELQILNNEVFIDNYKYDPDLILEWALSEQGEKYFKSAVNDSKTLCLVAENDEGKLVGYLAASPLVLDYRKSKYFEINNMGVIPDYRSQGIGEMLMTACLKWAKKNGYDRIFVNSYFKNTAAIKFYKKCGFSEIDVSLERDL